VSRNETRWLRPLLDLDAHGTFEEGFTRGFVEDLSLPAEAFVGHGDRLLHATPVTALHLSAPGAVGRRLADCPHPARIPKLRLGAEPPLSRADLQALLESAHAAGLRYLSLSNTPASDEDVTALAAASAVPALRGLTLRGTRITGATLPALLSRLGQLEYL